jgi:hypothetical protein
VDNLNHREIISSLIQIDESSKSTIVHSIKSGIEGLKRNMCRQIFQLGAYLIAAKAHGIWQIDGSGAHDFAEWLESEVGIKRSSGYDAMAVTSRFYPIIGKRPELEGIMPTRLVRLIPFTKGKSEDEIVELLHMAQNATCKGIENNLKKVPDDTCPHKESEAWNRCLKCGKFWK